MEEVVDITMPTLYDACATGRTDVVSTLLRAGVDENEGRDDGLTPLHTACLHGHKEIVGMLLHVPGIDVNPINRTLEQTPLMFACIFGHIEIVELLLNAPGINVDTPNKYGWTPLLIACYQGRQDIVDILLHAGADLNKATYDGFTMIHAANHSNNTHIGEMIRHHIETAGLAKAVHVLSI